MIFLTHRNWQIFLVFEKDLAFYDTIDWMQRNKRLQFASLTAFKEIACKKYIQATILTAHIQKSTRCEKHLEGNQVLGVEIL